MTFLSPGFLWAFALAAPLVAVYLLKVRPRRHAVSALFLWDRVFVERRSSSLLRRLRDAISLAMLLAVLIALALGAARPRFDGTDHRDVLLIVDRSVSMGESDDGATRLDRAKREAERVLAALPAGRRGGVAALDDRLDFLCFFTADRRRLRDAVRSITQTDLPSDRRALSSIDQLDDLAERVRIVLVSDGVGERFEIPEGVECLAIGDAPAVNAGFVVADLVFDADSGGIALLFQIGASVGVASDAAADVTLLRDGAPIKIMRTEIAPGINEPQYYTLPGESGEYALRLDMAGGLGADDMAYLVAHNPPAMRVGLAISNPYFYAHAVSAFERAERLMTLTTETAGADVVVASGDAARASADGDGPRLGYVVFAPPVESVWAEDVGEAIESPIARAHVDDHPAFRYLPIELLAFAGARAMRAPEGAAVLVEDASGVPLVWQMRAGEKPALVFNMDPALGDFVLSPYFPLLIRGAATHLAGRNIPPASTYATGSAGVGAGLSADEGRRVTAPDQEVRTVDAGGAVVFERAGFYSLESRTGARTLAASVLHRGETTDAPLEPLPEAPVGLARGRPVWVLLAVAALIVLVAEELLYHRRKVG